MRTTPMDEFFCGPSWASSQTQMLWEPRLRTAQAAWLAIERASVAVRLRQAAVLTLPPSDVAETCRWAADAGLHATPLVAARVPQQYASGPAIVGELGLKLVLHVPEIHPKLWYQAHAAQNHTWVGEQLGYPNCCRHFFEETWGRGSRDGTLQMRDHSGPVNILLRWLGVRLVPHLPCSASCRGSIHLQEQMLALGREGLGLSWRLAWLEEILAWPVFYSALNGVLEVTTPALRFCASTDWTEGIQRIGREGVYHEAPTPWEDNGFSSPETMHVCHSDILAVVEDAIRETKPARIVDLGCGEGLLLRRIFMEVSQLPCMGLEVDPQKVARGCGQLLGIDLQVGRVGDFEPGRSDLCLLMPKRMPRQVPHHAVVYAYSDWLQKEKGLEEMCKSQGLPALRDIQKRPGVIEVGWF